MYTDGKQKSFILEGKRVMQVSCSSNKLTVEKMKINDDIGAKYIQVKHLFNKNVKCLPVQ